MQLKQVKRKRQYMARNASSVAKGQSKPEQVTPPRPRRLSDDEVLAQSVLDSAARRGKHEVSFRPKSGSSSFEVPAVLAEVLRHIRRGFLPSL